MRIINLTPHTILLETPMGENLKKTMEFEPSGKVARLKTETIELPEEDNIPFVAVKYKEPEGLPQPMENTLFIVSGFVFENTDREDLIAPDTGPDSAIRDANGNIEAISRFKRRLPEQEG